MSWEQTDGSERKWQVSACTCTFTAGRDDVLCSPADVYREHSERWLSAWRTAEGTRYRTACTVGAGWWPCGDVRRPRQRTERREWARWTRQLRKPSWRAASCPGAGREGAGRSWCWAAVRGQWLIRRRTRIQQSWCTRRPPPSSNTREATVCCLDNGPWSSKLKDRIPGYRVECSTKRIPVTIRLDHIFKRLIKIRKVSEYWQSHRFRMFRRS